MARALLFSAAMLRKGRATKCKITCTAICGAAACFAISGCADKATGNVPPRLETVISGRAFFEGPFAGRRVVAFDFLNGVRGARLADATTDADGAYSMDVGVISGAILLEVDEAGAQPVVSAVADMIRLGEAKGSVQLSPITHLTAVYAQHLGERLGPAEAIVEARRAVEGLFGGVAHHAVPAVDVLTVGAPSSSAGLVAGVLSVAFSAQAEGLRTMPGSELGGDVSASALVRLYADDLRDGFVDGLSDGRSLRFAGHRLDAETFRAGYGEAVLRFLAGPRNATTVGPADFQSLVDSIRRNTGPLFPPDQPPRLDTEAPTFSMVSLERGEGERLHINPSISGRFVIEVRAQDNVGVAKISLAGNSTAAAGPDRVPAADHALYIVSPEGLEEGTQEWTIEAVDASGNAARSALLFRVDRTPPRILVSVPSVVVTSTVEISGEWMDASPGVVVLRSGRNEVARVNVAPGPFARTVPIPCGAAVEITALGVDAAGNPSATARAVTRCNAVGPQLGLLGTEVVDEGTLEITRDVTTGALTFLEGQGTLRTRISEGASSPMRFRSPGRLCVGSKWPGSRPRRGRRPGLRRHRRPDPGARAFGAEVVRRLDARGDDLHVCGAVRAGVVDPRGLRGDRSLDWDHSLRDGRERSGDAGRRCVLGRATPRRDQRSVGDADPDHAPEFGGRAVSGHLGTNAFARRCGRPGRGADGDAEPSDRGGALPVSHHLRPSAPKPPDDGPGLREVPIAGLAVCLRRARPGLLGSATRRVFDSVPDASLHDPGESPPDLH